MIMYIRQNGPHRFDLLDECGEVFAYLHRKDARCGWVFHPLVRIQGIALATMPGEEQTLWRDLKMSLRCICDEAQWMVESTTYSVFQLPFGRER